MPVKTYVFDTREEAVLAVAREMGNWIRTKRYQRGDAVLGLHSGAPMDRLAKELIRLSGVEEKGGLPVSGVRVFEMAEFVGRDPAAPGSMHHWLRTHLYDHWGARDENIHFPGADPGTSSAAEQCARYEELLAAADPIDVLPIPMGSTGRLGFHLPGVDPEARTALVELDEVTRRELAELHPEFTEVPTQALGIGLATIRQAKRVRILAFGADRAEAVRNALVADRDPNAPLSLLAGHKDCQLLLDPEAASAL